MTKSTAEYTSIGASEYLMRDIDHETGLVFSEKFPPSIGIISMLFTQKKRCILFASMFNKSPSWLW